MTRILIPASMFGGPSFGMGSGPPRRAQDSVIPYSVTLEDLYNGKTAHFALEKNVVCSHCQGTGGKTGAMPKDCVTCGGKGRVLQQRHAGNGMISQTVAPCSDCDGKGKKFREKDQCKKCHGKTVVSAKTRLRLEVPRGGYNGQRIVFEGEGDQLPNSKPASIIFELEQKPHDTFEVKNLDLLAKVRIPLSEALLGFSRTILTHLDGRHIHVTKAKGDVIRPGQVDVIKGEGMMDQRYYDQKGDLYISWDIEFPSKEWAQTVDEEVRTSHPNVRLWLRCCRRSALFCRPTATRLWTRSHFLQVLWIWYVLASFLTLSTVRIWVHALAATTMTTLTRTSQMSNALSSSYRPPHARHTPA